MNVIDATGSQFNFGKYKLIKIKANHEQQAFIRDNIKNFVTEGFIHKSNKFGDIIVRAEGKEPHTVTLAFEPINGKQILRSFNLKDNFEITKTKLKTYVEEVRALKKI